MTAGIPVQEHAGIVTAYGTAQHRAAAVTEAQAAAWWARLDTGDLTGSWLRTVGPALVRMLTAGQMLAATSAQTYINAMVAADQLASDYAPGADQVMPRAFAGQAADGRGIDTLLYQPVIRTKTLLAGGSTLPEAMVSGQLHLRRIVASEVADAGRGAFGVASAANRTVTGFVRQVRAGACSRCVILAGRWYRWDADFDRHKRCQCYGVPSTKARPGRHADPEAFFHGLSHAEQARRFTAAGAKAIRDGADIYSVVNARRSVYSVVTEAGRTIRATRDSTTRRGLYYQMEQNRALRSGALRSADIRNVQLKLTRLLPEQIYRTAGSRDEVIALLRRYGYLGWSP